ncbi:tetratricopeptide repeat protein [Streptomyces caniferus]|uniref:tetratricopeptide repeat protein n=1 Tax=Streptomyces caniferus TaxID=285557 RepID=UPI002E2E7119|nr:tetratricopeptide repeat protein [Streptomyces caniferus]
MADADDRSVANTISGGVFGGGAIQAETVHVHPPATTWRATSLAGLPRPNAAFIGRQAELDTLLRDLSPNRAATEQASVNVVTGLAGVGKTELVLQTAWRALRNAGWFPGGVLFIDLFGYDEDRSVPPEHALEEFLRALRVPGEHVPPGLQARTRLYRSLLAASSERGERVLVVVDNAATAEQVQPLMPGDVMTTVLVTSRHTLHVGGRVHNLGVLAVEESVDMLRDTLRQAHGTADTRVNNQLPDAERIAALCGNLPLAVQICAALLADIPGRPLSSLVGALTDVHRRLDGLEREERAVRAAFDLSYQRLTEPQSLLFRLLALVPGADLSSETAAVLADISTIDVEDLLQQLARAHLVDPGTAWGRWRMHDLVRLYADKCGRTLDAKDTRSAAQARLYEHFGNRVRDAVAQLKSKHTGNDSSSFLSREEAVSWLKDEREGLIAACRAALEIAPEITCRLAHGLTPFLDRHRYLDDWVAVAGFAVDAARRLENLSEARSALHIQGLAMREVGRLDEAQQAHELALKLYRKAGDRFGESLALDSLGLVLRHLGRTDDAIKAHTQALQILTEIRRVDDAPCVRGNMGNALRQAGRAAEAVEAFSAASDHCHAVGDRRGAAMAQVNLAGALVEARQPVKALAACRAALFLADELGETYIKALTLINRGRVAEYTEHPDQAVDDFTQALDLASALGDQSLATAALLNLGELYRRTGRSEDAFEALTRAADALRESGRQFVLGNVLIALSKALKDAERFEEAIRTANEALHIRRTSGDLEAEAEALSVLGALFLATDQVKCGAAVYAVAADVFHSLGNQPLAEGISRQMLGWLLMRLGALEDSVQAHSRAAELFRGVGDRTREGFALGDLARSLALLDRPEMAIEAGARALEALQASDDRLGEGQALLNLGGYLAAAGHLTRSAQATQRAVGIFHTLGCRLLEGRALHNLGLAQLCLGEASKAIWTYRQAVALLRTTEDRISEGQALLNLGAAQLASGEYASAAESLSQAIDIFHALGESTLESQARSALATARSSLGHESSGEG